MALKWEWVQNEGLKSRDYDTTYRTKVPGGWLIRTEACEGVGLTFYPDPNHKWDGNSLK
jgi:hypothetical protein